MSDEHYNLFKRGHVKAERKPGAFRDEIVEQARECLTSRQIALRWHEIKREEKTKVFESARGGLEVFNYICGQHDIECLADLEAMKDGMFRDVLFAYMYDYAADHKMISTSAEGAAQCESDKS